MRFVGIYSGAAAVAARYVEQLAGAGIQGHLGLTKCVLSSVSRLFDE